MESWTGQKTLSKARGAPGVWNAAKRRWDKGKKGIKQGRVGTLTTTRHLKQGGMLCVGSQQARDAWLCFVPAALELFLLPGQGTAWGRG